MNLPDGIAGGGFVVTRTRGIEVDAVVVLHFAVVLLAVVVLYVALDGLLIAVVNALALLGLTLLVDIVGLLQTFVTLLVGSSTY